MGGCGTKPNDQVSRQIELQLKEDKQKAFSTLKLLLLGAGESGKSTIAKQFRIINKGDFTEVELQEYRCFILDNIALSVAALIDAAKELQIEVEPEWDALCEKLRIDRFQISALLPDLKDQIARLWADPRIQTTFQKSQNHQINDNTRYFLDNLVRVAEPGYLPTQEDVLHCRIRTTGVIETVFPLGGKTVRLVDVGGQRSERRKWMGCFEDVTTVIFCVAVSDYNLTLAEDPTTNRMVESLNLFSEIVNKWFLETTVVLFLNKIDIFQEKLTRFPLSNTFSEYQGPNDYKSAASFVKHKFLGLATKNNQRLYSHYTCATDTKQVKVVFDAVTQTIIKGGLSDGGLL
eukprot:TRINITY_DN2900_c0_g1_i3.p1 TRINITY_DN2900_c0_g1~~TRINITY_DN2900_c0_g1_i3.p1  ORF type:complete len:347 (-),score=73.12 TRINITY_DN2900_c0_g1_i3:169-1209(-)